MSIQQSINQGIQLGTLMYTQTPGYKAKEEQKSALSSAKASVVRRGQILDKVAPSEEGVGISLANVQKPLKPEFEKKFKEEIRKQRQDPYLMQDQKLQFKLNKQFLQTHQAGLAYRRREEANQMARLKAQEQSQQKAEVSPDAIKKKIVIARMVPKKEN